MSVDAGDALLRAILEGPADDLPRLVYADWLDEHGDHARAEFVRVQCELAHTPLTVPAAPWKVAIDPTLVEDENPRWRRLRLRERELLYAPNRDGIPCNGFLWSEPLHRLGIQRGHWEGNSFRRGFVESVTLPLAAFLEHAADLFAAAPIAEVRLSDREPMPWHSPEAGNFVWVNDDHWPWNLTESASLPSGLFDCLPPGDLADGGVPEVIHHWSTVEACVAALSVACVRFGRRAAGLE